MPYRSRLNAKRIECLQRYGKSSIFSNYINNCPIILGTRHWLNVLLRRRMDSCCVDNIVEVCRSSNMIRISNYWELGYINYSPSS